MRLLKGLAANGKTVLGYGASTKGNVTLQFCGVTAAEIPAIAEVNPEKFGRVTPGARIPIISEAEARAMKPDYFLVLPWHFKEGILQREQEYIANGGKFIFPFPEIEIIQIAPSFAGQIARIEAGPRSRCFRSAAWTTNATSWTSRMSRTLMRCRESYGNDGRPPPLNPTSVTLGPRAS
jgi:hypothetical protein